MAKKNKGSIWKEFKAFISKGNVLDMAVGVVIGGAFGAIVTAVVNMLLSVCTFWVPGGIKGLVTVLPAATTAQKGVPGIGQKFAASNLGDATIAFAKSQDVVIDKTSDTYVQWQNALLSKYTLKGKTYICNMSATIDWGTLINAIISFIIIAITLFVIVKVAKSFRDKRMMLMDVEARALEKQEKNIPLTKKEKASLEAKAQREADEAAAKAEAEAKALEEANKPDPVVELLKEIRDSLQK